MENESFRQKLIEPSLYATFRDDLRKLHILELSFRDQRRQLLLEKFGSEKTKLSMVYTSANAALQRPFPKRTIRAKIDKFRDENEKKKSLRTIHANLDKFRDQR